MKNLQQDDMIVKSFRIHIQTDKNLQKARANLQKEYPSINMTWNVFFQAVCAVVLDETMKAKLEND